MAKNLIILAGGMSSRMKKSEGSEKISAIDKRQANTVSKGLIRLSPNGRPLLDYLLYNAKEAGFLNIYIVINEQGQGFKQLYGNADKDNNFNGLNISYVVQTIPSGFSKPLGTADAVLQAFKTYPNLKSENFSVCNCDNLYSTEALLAIRKTKFSNALIAYDRSALKFSSERISRFAILNVKQGLLVDIIEKPNVTEVEKYKDENGKVRISMNLFKFSGEETYQYFKDCPINELRNEKEIPTVLMNFLKNSIDNVEAIPFSEHVPDLTSKSDIEIMKTFIAEHYKELNW